MAEGKKMKIYDTKWTNPATGEVERETHYSLTEAKRWMKERQGSRGFITKVWANGEWEPCGEITLKGRNSVQMSNQARATYD